VLTEKQLQQFARDGYVLVRSVLTAEQVRWLRAFFRPKLDSPHFLADTDRCLMDLFGRYPEVRWLCFHEPTLRILRSLFGEDIVLLPEVSIHLNYFGNWHRDTTNCGFSGLTFFKEKDYLMWTVAYYLQENTSEYGGGLDVEPGSHRLPEDPFVNRTGYRERSILERVWHQINRPARRKYWLAREEYDQKGYIPMNVVSIPSRPGDLVIFDHRLNHHATPARGYTTQDGWLARGVLPVKHEKLGIFCTWSRNNAIARQYLDWCKTRDYYPHLIDFSYPADFLKEAEKAGVHVIY
jgi:hypothetical protein